MSRLAGEVRTEVLRMLYAFSTSRWPAALIEMAVVVLIVTFALAAWRLRSAVDPRVPARMTPNGREA